MKRRNFLKVIGGAVAVGVATKVNGKAIDAGCDDNLPVLDDVATYKGVPVVWDDALSSEDRGCLANVKPGLFTADEIAKAGKISLDFYMKNKPI